MNYHSDEWIADRVKEHYEEALTLFPQDRIVGIFCQGSQNYGLDVPNSDIDTKLIVLPTLKDISYNRQPVSTTHVRENNEHIDLKDIRLMFNTFRKQNLNFLEILFTKYKIVNPIYADSWELLIQDAERIAHYNIYSAVKAMQGHALEKYHAMEHKYPSKLDVLAKFSYDPKQLHHLVRIEDYIRSYISGKKYSDCLVPSEEVAKYLISIKNGEFQLDAAREIANVALDDINKICEPYTKNSIYNVNDQYVDELLNKVQYNIIKQSIKLELNKEEE